MNLPDTTAPNTDGPVVWILSEGEMHEGGCDWIALTPHPVVTALQVESGA